jgi:HEAT repeat protein/energy-coupling factor transporter ATP-binding protein EcfA2
VDVHELINLLEKYLPSIFWEKYDFFNKYFHVMKEEFETIKDISAIGQKNPIHLEEMYVPLKLSEIVEHEIPCGKDVKKEVRKKLREFQTMESRQEQVFDADDIVKKFDKVVVVGAPGSGKTTFLRHLALKFCIENLEKQEKIILPVFITLKGFLDSGKSLRDYIDGVFVQFDFPEATNFIEEDLEGGTCLILLDNFDESAAVERQQEVAKEIEEFAHKYDKNTFVVASRSAGYRGELKEFREVEVTKFDDQQIEQVVMNWFGKTDPDKAASMKNAIKENERIRKLARNPLMIAITAILFEEGKELPQRKVELYQQCVGVLLSRWDVARKTQNRYDAKAKEKILMKLALEAHSLGKKSFTRKEVLEKFSEYLSEVKIEKSEAEDVLKEIVERNALLVKGPTGMYDFLHFSFQEFLAARELWERKDYELLLQHLYEPWWEEVILLFAGFDRDATDLILKIKKKEKEDERFGEDIFYSNLMLMGKCIADADYTDLKVKEQIVNDLWQLYETEEFLRKKTMKILALIKPDTIVDSMTKNLKNEDRYVRWRAAYALGKIGSEKAVDPLIGALTTDEDSGVRGRAAEALGELGSGKAVDPLIGALTTDKDSGVRRRAVSALGELGSKKAVDPLIGALTTDKDSDVRLIAADALRKLGSKKAVDPLIGVLTADEDSDVRLVAADALGELGSKKAVDPLIGVLTADEDRGVRGSAAYALGELGSEKAVDPLMSILVKDKDRYIRRRAVSALGKIGSEKAVDPLMSILVKDKDRYIRRRAVSALGEIGSEKAVDPLMSILATDKDSDVRGSAAEVLEEISKKSKKRLLQKKKDLNPGNC